MISNSNTGKIVPLNGITLPQAEGYRREPAVDAQLRADDYDQRYDSQTLFYDCLWLASKQQLVLYCPKLLNFARLFREGEFSSNIGTHRLRKIIEHSRFSEIRLDCQAQPEWLSFRHEAFETRTDVSKPETSAFADLNCIITLSKDNDLTWIHDWVSYHVRRHQLQGLVLFDNNSSIYSPEDIVKTLRDVEGLQQFRVIPAPFPYGPTGKKKPKHGSKFLQAALRNLTRRRFFAEAGAVLWLDIDEMIVHRSGKSIFEETKSSLLGYREFDGQWAYRSPDQPGLARHHEHVYLRNGQVQPCRGKYCVAPNGPLRFLDWGTHHLQAPGLIRRFCHSDEFYLLHCFNISTSWKNSRESREGSYEYSADRDRLIND